MTTINNSSIIIQLGNEILEELRKPTLSIDWNKVIENNKKRSALMAEEIAKLREWINSTVDKLDNPVIE